MHLYVYAHAHTYAYVCVRPHSLICQNLECAHAHAPIHMSANVCVCVCVCVCIHAYLLKNLNLRIQSVTITLQNPDLKIYCTRRKNYICTKQTRLCCSHFNQKTTCVYLGEAQIRQYQSLCCLLRALELPDNICRIDSGCAQQWRPWFWAVLAFFCHCVLVSLMLLWLCAGIVCSPRVPWLLPGVTRAVICYLCLHGWELVPLILP